MRIKLVGGTQNIIFQGSVWSHEIGTPPSKIIFLCHCQILGSLLAFFHLCLVSVSFSGPCIPTWNEVLQKLFSSSCSFLGRFLSQLPDRTHLEIVSATHFRIRYHTADKRVYHLNITYVEMIATHRYSPLKMSSITLSYSPPSMLSHCRHPQVIFMQ